MKKILSLCVVSILIIVGTVVSFAETDISQELSDYLNENLGFLTSQYEDIKDIDIEQLLYSGANIETQGITEEEEEALGINNEDTLYDPLESTRKIKKQDVIDLLKQKTNLSENEISEKINELDNSEGYTYIEKYDAYYYVRFDTNLITDLKIEDYKINNGLYEIAYSANYLTDTETKYRKVTLQKDEDTYKFVSHKLLNSLEEFKKEDTQGEVNNNTITNSINNVINNNTVDNNTVNNSTINNNVSINNTLDNTISNSILPKTGGQIVEIVLIISIVVLLVIGIGIKISIYKN